MVLLGFKVGWNSNSLFNEEEICFRDQLEKSSRPLFEGSPDSTLSIAVGLMNITSDWNVPNETMDLDPNLKY